MTEEKKNKYMETGEKSTSQLLRELLRLLLLLVWKFTIWLFKKLLKALLWCMQAIENAWHRMDEWWHDNDTQAKVAKTKAWIRKAAAASGACLLMAAKTAARGSKIGTKAAWRGLRIAAKATAKGMGVATRATIQGIIHLRPTIKKIVQMTVQGGKACIVRAKLAKRGARLAHIRRKRNYADFRRNGGIKGWMSRTSHSIRRGIETFMEEDQSEAAPDAVTEDDLIRETMEQGASEGKKSMQIGKQFISQAKNLMDVE